MNAQNKNFTNLFFEKFSWEDIKISISAIIDNSSKKKRKERKGIKVFFCKLTCWTAILHFVFNRKFEFDFPKGVCILARCVTKIHLLMELSSVFLRKGQSIGKMLVY